MAMTVREVLEAVKVVLGALDPVPGRLHISMVMNPNQEEVVNQFIFRDEALGDVIKGFIIKPANSRSKNSTTGQNGYRDRLRNFVVQGVISTNIAGKDAPDLILESEMDRIEDKLASVGRIQEGQDIFINGEMEQTALGLTKFASHNVFVKELTFVVQERRQRS